MTLSNSKQDITFLQFLSSIRIVMVNTTLPANIGSTARAMHTMGMTDLVVVTPKHPLDDDAYAHAAGAKHILEHMRTVDTLSEAIADCQWVMATSSRQRHIPKPVLTPRQAATVMIDNFQQVLKNQTSLLPSSYQMALVFGREDRGLTNEELQLADYHIQIPANPAYGVLNVAAAVQVIVSIFYEMAEERLLLAPSSQQQVTTDNQINLAFRQEWDAPAITSEQKLTLETRCLALLSQLGIYDADQSKVLPQRVSRLLGRLQLDTKEYQLIQALIAKLLKS